MTIPDPIEAAIAAAGAALFGFNTTAGHHFVMHDMGGEGDPYNQLAAIAIRAAAPILIAAGYTDGRQAAAKAIEADPGIPVYFNRKNGDTEEQQHDDPILIRSDAARIARGGDG